MDDFQDPRPTPRRARIVRSGLLGLAAAGLVGAVALAAGSGLLPVGTFAANDASQAPSTQTGPGEPGGRGFRDMDGDHDGRRGGIGRAITVKAIDGSNLSLATDDGWSRTIAISSDTTIEKAGATIALGDVKVGDEVRFSQTKQADGSYHIDKLVVVLPHLGGQVTAIDGSTITVKLRDGSTATITVASGATIEVAGKTATLADIKVGMVVQAQGTKTGDAALTATNVRAFDPASAPMGGGRHGGHGMGTGPNAPDASAAPSTDSTNG